MDYAKALVIAGVFLSVYPVGQWISTRFNRHAESDATWNPLLKLAVGSAAWTLLLMTLGLASAFRTMKIGVLGWCIFVGWSIYQRPWAGLRVGLKDAPALDTTRKLQGIALIGILFAGGWLYALFPKESLFGERDEGLYVQHALQLSRAGQSFIDLKALGVADDPYISAIHNGQAPEIPGLYPTHDRWTFQFSSATSVWMALLNTAWGPAGLYRFNAIIGVLLGLAFFFLVRECLPAKQQGWAVPAVAVYMLNPAQMWISRNTLSEPFCAWFLITGLLALAFSLRRQNLPEAVMGGALIGMTVFVRIDSVAFMLSFPMAACVAVWLGYFREGEQKILIASVLSCFAISLLALGYYAVFVGPYAQGLADRLLPAVAGALFFGAALWALSVKPILRINSRHRSWLAFALMASVAAAFIYGLWVRPHVEPYTLIESKLVPQLNGHRDYSELTLRNLAAYLTLPVVLIAALGLLRSLRLALLLKLSPGQLLILVTFLVPTILYLWRPMVSPDHIWAARRWIPAVFPATIFLAACGTAYLASKARISSSLLPAIASAVAVGGVMLWLQRDTLLLREDEHVFERIAALAGQLDGHHASYVMNASTLVGPLWAGFGRPAVPVVSTDFRRDFPGVAKHALCSPPLGCQVVHFAGTPIAGTTDEPVARLEIQRLRRNTSFEAVPSGTYKETYILDVTRFNW